MSGNLNLNTAMLASAASAMHHVAGTYAGMKSLSPSAADAVGNEGLSAVMRDFCTAWQRTQADMSEAITALGDGFSLIAEGFDAVDDSLATSLDSPSSRGSGATR